MNNQQPIINDLEDEVKRLTADLKTAIRIKNIVINQARYYSEVIDTVDEENDRLRALLKQPAATPHYHCGPCDSSCVTKPAATPAPNAPIVQERVFGDTYSGSGGAGGDWDSGKKDAISEEKENIEYLSKHPRMKPAPNAPLSTGEKMRTRPHDAEGPRGDHNAPDGKAGAATLCLCGHPATDHRWNEASCLHKYADGSTCDCVSFEEEREG